MNHIGKTFQVTANVVRKGIIFVANYTRPHIDQEETIYISGPRMYLRLGVNDNVEIANNEFTAVQKCNEGHTSNSLIQPVLSNCDPVVSVKSLAVFKGDVGIYRVIRKLDDAGLEKALKEDTQAVEYAVASGDIDLSKKSTVRAKVKQTVTMPMVLVDTGGKFKSMDTGMMFKKLLKGERFGVTVDPTKTVEVPRHLLDTKYQTRPVFGSAVVTSGFELLEAVKKMGCGIVSKV